NKHKATMEIEFSGPVGSSKTARGAMTFTIDGKPANGVTVLPSHNDNSVLIAINDKKIVLGAKLGLAIKKDVPSAAGAKAAAATADYAINDKVIKVERVAEGTESTEEIKDVKDPKEAKRLAELAKKRKEELAAKKAKEAKEKEELAAKKAKEA